MRILDLSADNTSGIEQAAALLVEGFRDSGSSAWRELPAALAEVRAFFQPGRICRIAVDDAGTMIGWIGGIETYDGHVWELHPLVVKEGQRGRGVGRGRHPFEFYQKVGYTIVGVVPDANGPGKPDIWMAKRV